ncbi:hypothetical protein [Serpentinicella alkaliphila]|nr:hypothetical protein [Serpentinicella alkaliphila]
MQKNKKIINDFIKISPLLQELFDEDCIIGIGDLKHFQSIYQELN